MIKSYKLFFTLHCPKCPAVKAYLEKLDLKGEFIDAGTEEGLDEARKLNVADVPTVVFFDENNEEAAREHDVMDVKRVLKEKEA